MPDNCGLSCPNGSTRDGSVHPTMCPLYHPPTRLVPRLLFDGFRFLPPRPDVRREPEFRQQVADLLIVIAFVQAHALRLLWGRGWPLHRETGDCLPRHLEVIPVGALHGEADRHAAAV